MNCINEILTPREQEVLELAFSGEGMTCKEIGEKLCLSQRTIEFYMARIRDGLGKHCLLGVYKEAVRLGLLPPLLPEGGYGVLCTGKEEILYYTAQTQSLEL